MCNSFLTTSVNVLILFQNRPSIPFPSNPNLDNNWTWSDGNCVLLLSAPKRISCWWREESACSSVYSRTRNGAGYFPSQLHKWSSPLFEKLRLRKCGHKIFLLQKGEGPLALEMNHDLMFLLSLHLSPFDLIRFGCTCSILRLRLCADNRIWRFQIERHLGLAVVAPVTSVDFMRSFGRNARHCSLSPGVVKIVLICGERAGKTSMINVASVLWSGWLRKNNWCWVWNQAIFSS